MVDDAQLRSFLGREVRARRHKLGLHSKQLGAKSGLGENYISAIENGHTGLRVLTLFRLAAALEMTTTELVERVEMSIHKDEHATRRWRLKQHRITARAEGNASARWAQALIGTGNGHVRRAPITLGVWAHTTLTPTEPAPGAVDTVAHTLELIRSRLSDIDRWTADAARLQAALDAINRMPSGFQDAAMPSGPYDTLRRSPYDRYMDGRSWRFVLGRDVPKDPYTARNALHRQAHRRGLRIKTRVHGDHLYMHTIGLRNAARS